MVISININVWSDRKKMGRKEVGRGRGIGGKGKGHCQDCHYKKRCFDVGAVVLIILCDIVRILICCN